MRTATIWQLGLVALTLLLNSQRASAEIVFHEDDIDTTSNLQFNDNLEGGPAVTIRGITQDDIYTVDITRIDAAPILLYKAANGQARVQATATNDTGAPVLFSGALFEIVNDVVAAFEFNLIADEDGILTIIVEDINGIFYSSDDDPGFNGAISSNGNNRFGVTATPGMEIVSVQVMVNGQILDDVRQIRMSGFAAVPEPTSIAFALFGLAGFVFFLRSKLVQTNR